MATAEELLSGVLNGTSDSITVDSDLRRIIIPDSIRNIGVESDEEVLELKFSLPRYYGRFDLSEFKIWVNYLTANGEPDNHDVKEVVVDDDTIAFIWQVGRHTTSYRGDVVFSIRLCKYYGHIILKEFNTTIATLPVLEGLQTGEAVVQNHADLLEQWRIDLFGLGDSKVQAIENAGDVELAAIDEAGAKSVDNVQEVEENILNTLEEQRLQSIDDVHQKGVEVLDSIPEDYTTMNNQVESLMRFTGPVIREEVSGEAITISDSSNNPLLGLNIYGKSEQANTKGYQLFDADKFTTVTNLGITVTNNGDGSFTISGEPTSSAATIKHLDLTHEETVKLFKAGMLNLKCEQTTNPAFYARLVVDNAYAIVLGNLDESTWSREITQEMLDNETTYMRYSFYYSDRDITTVTIKPMLYQEGDGTWEPYTGGKPSPNPEYPQKIKIVEKPTINVHGKNVIPYPFMETVASTIDGITFTDNGDGTVTVNGTATEDIVKTIVYNAPVVKGTYKFNGCPAGGSTNTYCASVRDVAYTVLKYDIGNGVEIVFNEDVGVVVNIRIKKGCQVNSIKFDLMLRPALYDDNSYEVYKKQSVASTVELLAIPVSSGGNYTDENGQQWIADYRDWERGVDVQMIKTVTLDGSQVVHKNSTTWLYYYVTPNKDMDTTIPALCDRLSFKESLSSMENDHKLENLGFNNISGTYGVIYFTMGYYMTENTGAAMIEALKQYPLTFMYALKNPIETPIPTEELLAYKALHTNYPNTTIVNDSNAPMEVAYGADTKIYIDKKFAELQAALTNNA